MTPLEYYHVHKAEIAIKRKARRLANLEHHRALGRANYRRHTEQSKAYRESRRAVFAAYMRARRLKNGDAVRGYEAQWRKANPERAKLKWKTKRARKYAARVVTASAELRRARLLMYGQRCTYCAKPVRFDLPTGHKDRATEDHVIPLSRGGPDCLSNLRLACHPCNASKHTKTLAEWVA